MQLIPARFLPRSFAQLFIRPKVFQQLNLRLFTRRVTRRRDYGHDIVAIRLVQQAKHSSISPRGAGYLPLLAQMMPGQKVRFEMISLDEAQRLYLAREQDIGLVTQAIEQRRKAP